jgi:histidinol dehydrogenase
MQRIGVVGIGIISKIYLDNLTGMFSKRVKLTAVMNTTFKKARNVAEVLANAEGLEGHAQSAAARKNII